MRVINCEQQTEEWERWRNRPTASEFGSFVTPARGDYSAQATGYAAKIVAKRLGVYTEPPPSYWMEWGIENEPNAVHAYEMENDLAIERVGFVLPDHTDAFGGSPDGLVGNEGLLEIKCPAPETLIMYHANGELPSQYKPQVQGLLLITQRAWCDFYAFHPMLTPFVLRVEPDESYQAKIAMCLERLLDEISVLETKVRRVNHHLVSVSKTEMRWDDE